MQIIGALHIMHTPQCAVHIEVCPLVTAMRGPGHRDLTHGVLAHEIGDLADLKQIVRQCIKHAARAHYAMVIEQLAVNNALSLWNTEVVGGNHTSAAIYIWSFINVTIWNIIDKTLALVCRNADFYSTKNIYNSIISSVSLSHFHQSKLVNM
jgi:hypothetical protein